MLKDETNMSGLRELMRTRIHAKIVETMWKRTFWFASPPRNDSGHGRCVRKSTMLMRTLTRTPQIENK